MFLTHWNLITFVWNAVSADECEPYKINMEQAVVLKHNKPRPRVAHRGIMRFLQIDPKLNHVIPWSLRTFSENFMQIGLAVFS